MHVTGCTGTRYPFNAVANCVKRLRKYRADRLSPQRLQVAAVSCNLESAGTSGHVRVFAISDLHTDHHDNLHWVTHLKNTDAHNSILIVAGDISDDIRVLRTTLQLLKQQFLEVFFVAGNHELWVKSDEERNQGATDSVQKLQAILGVCRELGVHVSPKQLGHLWIAPIQSWHHQSFDQEPDIDGVPRATAFTIVDYRACRWPESVTTKAPDCPNSDDVARWFDQLNGAMLKTLPAAGCDIISFSHFLPYQQLLPEKRFLRYPNLAKAVGSSYLAAHIQQLKPQLHIFGHTHFGWDATVDGTRFIQAPLCYPKERQQRMKTIELHPDSALRDSPIRNLAGIPWLPLQVYYAEYSLRDCSVDETCTNPLSEHLLTSFRHLQGPGLAWQATWCGNLSSVWGKHYQDHARDPTNTEAVMSIAKLYRRRHQSQT